MYHDALAVWCIIIKVYKVSCDFMPAYCTTVAISYLVSYIATLYEKLLE